MRLIITKTLFLCSLIVVNPSDVIGTEMTCAIPLDPKDLIPRADYIKLMEPKTTIILDVSRDVTKVSSPGCHKFRSILSWTDSFSISCDSIHGQSITLEINTLTLELKKTYSEDNGKVLTLTGFCRA